MKKTSLLLLLLVAVGCGSSEPPPATPVAVKPKPAERRDTGLDVQDADAAQQALSRIENATSEDEANQGRALYDGKAEAAMLDRVLSRKLIEIDFAQLTGVINAVKKTETPDAADEAAKAYTGTRYSPDLNGAVEEHIAALVKKNPTLRRTGTGSTKPPTPGTDLKGLFKGCQTESDADAARAAYKGPGTEAEIEAARELWRWNAPELIGEATVSFSTPTFGRFHLLRDGRVLASPVQSTVSLVNVGGTVERTFAPAGARESFFVGTSPDEAFVYTRTTSGKCIQKWDLPEGKLALEFADVTGTMRAFVEDAVLAPDGGLMLTRASDGTLALWNAETGELARTLERVSQVKAMRFTADGAFVFIFGNEAVRSNEVSTGNQATRYNVTKADFYTMDLSADGATVAVRTIVVEESTGDGPPRSAGDAVLFLDGQTGKSLGQVRVEAGVFSIHWLRSGRHVLVRSLNEWLLIDAVSLTVVSRHSTPESVSGSFLNADRVALTHHCWGVRDQAGRVTKPNVLTYGRRP